MNGAWQRPGAGNIANSGEIQGSDLAICKSELPKIPVIFSGYSKMDPIVSCGESSGQNSEESQLAGAIARDVASER